MTCDRSLLSKLFNGSEGVEVVYLVSVDLSTISRCHYQFDDDTSDEEDGDGSSGGS